MRLPADSAENHHTLRISDLLDGGAGVEEEIAAAMRHLRHTHGLRRRWGAVSAALLAHRIALGRPTVGPQWRKCGRCHLERVTA
jgi:hypothetical protein